MYQSKYSLQVDCQNNFMTSCLLFTSGLIGRSFTMLFVAAGYKVDLYDIVDTQVQHALSEIKDQLVELENMGLMRGTLTKEEQHARITGKTSLEDCVAGAKFILVH